MKQPRLAIIHKKRDLLRLAPRLDAEANALDLAITVKGGSFQVDFLPEDLPAPVGADASGSPDDEPGDLPPVLFAKNKKKGRAAGRCSFAQEGVAALSRHGEFPVPLCSIQVAKPEGPDYCARAHHRVVNLLDDYGFSPNTLEVFYADAAFDTARWLQRWPNLGLLSTMTSLDALVGDGPTSGDGEEGGAPERALAEFIRWDFETDGVEFSLLCRPRFLPWVRKNRIRFYRSLEYVDLLGIQPVQLVDERSGKPIGSRSPAFVRDLAIQRARGVPAIELRTWELVFQIAQVNHQHRLPTRRSVLIPIGDDWTPSGSPTVRLQGSVPDEHANPDADS
jgi:hypothetical protein